MKVIVAGGGPLLYFIARTLNAKGHRLTIIDRDSAECGMLAERLRATVIAGDASDPRILAEAEAIGADAVLAITAQDQDNLVICQLAVQLFDVPRAVALANDPDNADVFEKLGVAAFSTAQIIGEMVEKRAIDDRITNFLPIGEGKVNVTELTLADEAPVNGRLLREIELPPGALVAVVMRGEETIIPRGNDRLLPGDRLVVITTPAWHGPALRALTGEKDR